MTRISPQACFEQIKGFGSYGFPESHAASFALLVYVSAWIKKHHPAAFAAALLNSQPMGFYAPAEIVRCAREHRRARCWRPMPPSAIGTAPWSAMQKARCACGWAFARSTALREDDAHTIMNERGYGYRDFADFVRRTALAKRALVTLAEADAFRGFGLDRREGLWAVRRLPDDDPLPLFAHEGNRRRAPEQGAEQIAPLPVMPLSEHVLADYQTMRLSLKGLSHPVPAPAFRRRRHHPLRGRGRSERRRLRPLRRGGAGAPAAGRRHRHLHHPQRRDRRLQCGGVGAHLRTLSARK